MLQHPYFHNQPIHQSEDITPERLKLKQLKHRVSITPRPIPHPIFACNSHDLIHPPPFNHEMVPQFVQYQPFEYPYLEGLQVDPPSTQYISTPNKEPFYIVNPQQPFNIHPHHHFEQSDHDLVRCSNPPQPYNNHQQFQQVDENQLKIDQQFQSAFPIDCVPGVVKQVLGDTFNSKKDSNLEITILKNRPLSLDPQLNTPFKKFNVKEDDIKKGEKIILIDDDSSEESSEWESEVPSVKLQDPSFIVEQGTVYEVTDSDDEESIKEQENEQESDEKKEMEQSEDEESEHLISDHNSIIQESTLPTQPKSPEHIKSSLEVDQHTAKTNLYSWSFIFQYTPKEELTVSIIGKTNPDGNRNFTTSPVVHRINSNTVLTENGTKYVLTSSFDSLRNQGNNASVCADFLQQFTSSLDGPFPKNWRELVEKEFKRLEEPVLESSNNFLNDNNFDYQIGGLDESSLNEKSNEPTTKRKAPKNKIFEVPKSPQKSPVKIKPSKKKRRKRYEQSSDEEDEEYVEPTPTEKKKKRKSVQTSILNTIPKQVDSVSLTDELKSTLLSWRKGSLSSSPKILEPIKEMNTHNYSPEATNENLKDPQSVLSNEEQPNHEKEIELFYQNNDFYNDIGGLSQEEDANNRDEMIEDIMKSPEPKKTKRKGRKSTRKKTTYSITTSKIVEDIDLNISLPQVVLPTEFVPKPQNNRKTKTKKVSLSILEKAWFGGVE